MSSTPTKADQENTENITETLTTVSKQLLSCVNLLNTNEDTEEQFSHKQRKDVKQEYFPIRYRWCPFVLYIPGCYAVKVEFINHCDRSLTRIVSEHLLLLQLGSRRNFSVESISAVVLTNL